MRRLPALLVAAAAAAALAGGAASTVGAPAWDYAGALGPQAWGSLDPAYAACSTGRRQSPVALPRPGAAAAARPLAASYRPSGVVVENNGHTVEAEVSAGNTLQLDGRTYRLVQFHFHAPSEHTLGGRRFPLELHLVHKTADGRRIAVIGVLIEPGRASAALRELLATIPARAGAERELHGRIDPAALLPAPTAVLRYVGSLTTPPCTEGVRWLVLGRPLELSRAQIARFTRLYDRDSRPLQPLNGRAVALR